MKRAAVEGASTGPAGFDGWSERLIAIALLSAPWAGVGLVHFTTGRVIGTGVQPAFLPMFGLLVLSGYAAVGRAFGTRTTPPLSWMLLMAWTLASTTGSWTFDHLGIAGEVGWSKTLKQWAMLGFFVATVCAVVATGRRVRPETWWRWERAASCGLAIAVVVALLQALGSELGLPGTELLGRLTSSNPSIAAGSEELYLGHRFVGIPRLRGPMPEPLLFGSYLLAAVPATAAAACRTRGWARGWRVAAVLGGLLCLLATFSRGAWLGAVVTATVLAVGAARGILPRPGRHTLWRVTALAVLVLGLGATLLTGRAPWELPGLLVARLSQSATGHDMSNMTRVWAWAAAWQLFLDHPWVGVGWGGFGLQFYQVAPTGADAAHFGWPVTNNLPLMVLAETGAVGFGLWCWALAPSLRAFAGRRPSPGAYLLAAVCAGVLAQGLTFSQWNLPHLWLLVALSAAWSGRDEDMVRDLQARAVG